MNDKTILLVEDNSDDQVLVMRAFKKSNFMDKVVVVRDGAAALDYLFARDPGEMPGVVLLDLKLPKVNGLEVLQRLRADERTQFLPVVMLTSSDEERDINASYDLGINSYICKPVDFVRFAEAVRRLGVYWLALNVAPPQKKRVR